MRSGLNEFVLRQSRTTKERKTSDSGVLRFPLKPFSLSWALVLLAPSPCPLTAPSSSPNDGQERGRAERLGRRGKYMPSSLSLSLSLCLSLLSLHQSASQLGPVLFLLPQFPKMSSMSRLRESAETKIEGSFLPPLFPFSVPPQFR